MQKHTHQCGLTRIDMTYNNDIQGFRRFNFFNNVNGWILDIVMSGIVVFRNVGVFTRVDGGDFVGLLGDFSDGFGDWGL